MKRMSVECDCERGGDCNKTTVCATDSALQDQAEEYETRIQRLIDDWTEELFTYRHPDSFARELKEAME
jgi:hypothetical protein